MPPLQCVSPSALMQPKPLACARSWCTTWSLPAFSRSCQPALWPLGSALNQRDKGNPKLTKPPKAPIGRCLAITQVPPELVQVPAPTIATVQPICCPPAASLTLSRVCTDCTWYSPVRSEEHTSEPQSLRHLVCRLL